MELYGTPVAQTSRMRERPASTNPSLLVQAASVETPKQAEEKDNAAASQDDGVDKYDISTIACTD